MKYTIEIEIKNLQVGDDLYSFDYSIFTNGENQQVGSYEGDYSVRTDEFRKELENGYALELVLQEYNFN